MKKLFFAMLAMAAFVSCSKENFSLGVEDQVEVTFNVAASQLQTRAYGDGVTANDLHWAIYLRGSNTPLFSGEIKDAFPGNQHTCTFSQTLAIGKSYVVVFWADSADDPYEVNWRDNTVSLNTEDLMAQDENLDAFYLCDSFDVKYDTRSVDFSLKRPFAQLNVATADVEAAEAAGLTVTHTSIAVSKVYTKMNLLTGEVVGQPQTLEFSAARIPSGENRVVTLGNNRYSLLSMNYLLVNNRNNNNHNNNNNGQLSDVTFKVYESVGYGNNNRLNLVNTSNFNQITLKRNHRTYIVGNLLTNDVNFKVTIVDEFDNESNPIIESR